MNSIHTQNKHINLHALQDGLRDGIPIALGYLAVSFSLGIAAQAAGLTPFQGFLASITTNASAGEYACFMAISTEAAITELLLIMLITNGRYLLMSCSLSQKFSPGTPLGHRLLAAFAITDEIFGISIARGGYLNPFYMYGAILIASPCWALGTVLGIGGRKYPAPQSGKRAECGSVRHVSGCNRSPGQKGKDYRRTYCSQLCFKLCFRIPAGCLFPFLGNKNNYPDPGDLSCGRGHPSGKTYRRGEV